MRFCEKILFEIFVEMGIPSRKVMKNRDSEYIRALREPGQWG